MAKANNTPVRAVRRSLDREGQPDPLAGAAAAGRRDLGQHLQQIRSGQPVRRVSGVRVRAGGRPTRAGRVPRCLTAAPPGARRPGILPRTPPRRHQPRAPPRRHEPRARPRRHEPRAPPRRHQPRTPPRRHQPRTPPRRHQPRTPPRRHQPGPRHQEPAGQDPVRARPRRQGDSGQGSGRPEIARRADRRNAARQRPGSAGRASRDPGSPAAGSRQPGAPPRPCGQARRAEDLQAVRRRRLPALGVGPVVPGRTPDGTLLGYAAQASRKDARDAVRAARSAFAGWSGATAYNRGQVLYRVAELMEGRSAQFAADVAAAEGLPASASMITEFSQSGEPRKLRDHEMVPGRTAWSRRRSTAGSGTPAGRTRSPRWPAALTRWPGPTSTSACPSRPASSRSRAAGFQPARAGQRAGAGDRDRQHRGRGHQRASPRCRR